LIPIKAKNADTPSVRQARAADAIMSPLTARRMATPHLARDEARPIANLPELIHKKSRHLEVPFVLVSQNRVRVTISAPKPPIRG
jgi:hypothetical protein